MMSAAHQLLIPRHEMTASSYVSSGLVAMWDGIENAGFGQHDSTVRSVDLTGNHAALSGFSSMNDNSMVFVQGDYAELTADQWSDIRSVMFSGNFTFQFCGEPDAATSKSWWTIMSSSPNENYGRISFRPNFTTTNVSYKKAQAAVFGDDGATWGGTGPGMGLNNSYDIPDLFDGAPESFKYLTVGCSSDRNAYVIADSRYDFVTGEWPVSSTSTGSVFFGREKSDGAIGNCASGLWHSLRIYSRKLTDRELLHNRIVDSIRFNLPL